MKNFDRWLAEEVMGWEYSHRETGGMYRNGDDLIANWQPTQNIEQTFQVVEKINDCLHLKQHGILGEWSAMFCGLMMKEISANTPEFAICKAAEMAIKGERNDRAKNDLP